MVATTPMPRFAEGPLSAADLETVLDAWQSATASLEQTHLSLREEVKRLTDELQAKNRELARKSRLADLGQMASHVAHEVRNNLVPVSLYLSLLRRHVARDDKALEMLSKVETGILSLDSTVNDLLHFTADREPKLSECVVGELIYDIVGSLQLQLAAQCVAVELAIPESLVAVVDRDMLRRALLNLSLNAVDAMPNGGRLMYSIVADGDCFELSVADTGTGLDEESMRRAFEPFYTTKNTGTGLGLAIVWRVAEVHDGICIVANRSDSGAVFTLRLPINRRESKS